MEKTWTRSRPYTIIYEDDNIIAVNKAHGISVTSERWETENSGDSLYKILKNDLQSEVFICHRLDRDTSGVIIFAKNAVTHKQISAAFSNREIKKTYIAIVHGKPLWKEESCDAPLRPDGNKRHLTIIDKYHGKKSLTKFIVMGGAANYTILRALPQTGRTHQIRVHAAFLCHPIVCDKLYGADKRSAPGDHIPCDAVYLSAFKRGWKGDRTEERPLLSRLALHSETLELPYNNLTLSAPLPKDMNAAINQLKVCLKE
jgi:RluA family pseudouridine synthase